jgi:Radical SAM superfamily
VRLLLISTYELGHQPIHLATAASALRQAGIEVTTVDLSVEAITASDLESIDAVAFSVPMHTAMRLASRIAEEIRAMHPLMPMAFYGLYAGVGGGGIDQTSAFAGEYLDDLMDWALALGSGTVPPSEVTVVMGHPRALVPDRSGLPSHEEYARLEWEGVARLAAAVEGSHGCRHRCRHCPIPVVYDGRLRVVGAESVLADVSTLASAGVEHVTFADPDFLNAPRYSMGLLRDAHDAHPELTFDVTVKVEHILAHRDLWPEMAGLGVLFVTSAFESVDDRTLVILDKGHTVADMGEAVEVTRSAGVHLRPTWLPFLPWTKPSDLADLVRFLDAHSLWPATDPVQLAIKLLLPEGSLLQAHPAVEPYLIRYDLPSLTWLWDFEDPATAVLHKQLDAIAADASDCGAESKDTLAEMRQVIGTTSGVGLGDLPAFTSSVPRLTESWFCCAEPTAAQAIAVTIGVGRVPG